MPQIKIKYPDGDPETFTSIAALADAYGQYKEDRLAAEKVAKTIEEREKFLKKYLIENVSKSDARGVIGKVWSATIKSSIEATLEDFDVLWAWATKKKRSDMLQRRLNTTAVKELWEAGEEVPGVGRISVATVSLSKVKP